MFRDELGNVIGLPPRCRTISRYRSSPDTRYRAHQVECGTPQESVWIAEGLGQFEVIVILSQKQLDRLAGGFGRGGKI
jgi:hypothetical protein